MTAKEYLSRYHLINIRINQKIDQQRLQRGLPRITRTAEYHTGCVDEAFVKGFTESVIAEDAETKKRIAERRAARKAKNNDKTET